MAALREFLAMGGYAGFVWPAYGLATLILGAIGLQSGLAYRRNRRELDRLQRGTPRR